jgi:hypothetical protein
MRSQSRKVAQGTGSMWFRDGEYSILCSAVCYFTSLSVWRLHSVNDRMIDEHGAESYHLHNHRCEDLKSCEYGTVGEVRIDRGNRNAGRKRAPVPLCSPQTLPPDISRIAVNNIRIRWNPMWHEVGSQVIRSGGGGFPFILSLIIKFFAIDFSFC